MYSLRKSRLILKSAYKWYTKKGAKLSPTSLQELEKLLGALDNALLSKDKSLASQLAEQVEEKTKQHFQHTYYDWFKELVVALTLALVLATLVKQTWFEHYEIPTGSMRPTFREQDHLTVSKIQYGINIPLQTDHFYFDPALVQRSSVVILTADQLPLANTDSTFLGIIPYKKRFIKRLIGKPGDTLYFYGGKIYGVDKEGNPLEELLKSPSMAELEHVPFNTFEGTVVRERGNQLLFYHMHLPLGRLKVPSLGKVSAEVFTGKEWVKENPKAAATPHNEIQAYSDPYGIRNFAMARLLTKKELEAFSQVDTQDLEEAPLYLELRHTPSLTSPPPKSYQHTANLTPLTTVIPVQEKHLKALMDALYTARFVVRNGKASNYSHDTPPSHSGRLLTFSKVPNGTYEFYHGKASKISWGGLESALPADHPLYTFTPQNVQKLFNLGINVSLAYAPNSKRQVAFPHRYAYFRNGDLYLLGVPLYTKDDPLLIAFQKKELEKERRATTANPYIAFKDWGPPLTEEGELDVEFIRTFGLTVPERHYFVLGDNHAMSGDSRMFGFVPEENLQGVPSLIIWPFGSRFGRPNQTPYPTFTLPRLIIWGIAAFIALVAYLIHLRNCRRPIFKKLYDKQVNKEHLRGK